MAISTHCLDVHFCNAKMLKVLPDAQDGSSKLSISTVQKGYSSLSPKTPKNALREEGEV